MDLRQYRQKAERVQNIRIIGKMFVPVNVGKDGFNEE